MTYYIGTPTNQLQAHAVSGCPVLVSFAAFSPFLDAYAPSFDRLLLDSGAYSELNSGVKIDLVAYVEWAEARPWADAWAGLDDISGDWRRSLRNYEAGGFPTFHDTDPEGLLDDLIPMARERGGWLGIGLKPPRTRREDWLRRTLERIPPDIHVHGWALWSYSHLSRLDSFDSTHTWIEWAKYRNAMPWLTPAECIDIAIKKVSRRARMIEKPDTQVSLALTAEGGGAMSEWIAQEIKQ